MIVTLTPEEMITAATIGVRRQVENITKNRKVSYDLVDGAEWQIHIEGCLGEMAVAKALGIYWSGNLGQLRMPDVGLIEVRTSSKPNYRLILHPKDNDDAPFVLVTGVNGKYAIRGWIMGRDGKKPDWWCDPKGGRPAFFVPQAALYPLETLKEAVYAF